MNILLACLAGFFRLFSPKALQSLGRFCGAVLWFLAPERRRMAVESAMRHLGMEEREATTVIKESFKQNCMSFLEIFHAGQSREDSPEIVIATPELYEAIKAEKGPVIAATGHLGSWEKLAGVVMDVKPGTERMIVVRNYRSQKLNDCLFALRGARGASILGHRNASAHVLEGLRKGGLAAFLVDHNSSVDEAVFMPFLGETAAVNVGPAFLAVRAKAVVYGVFLLRGDDGKYYLHITEPLRTETLTGSIREKVQAVAAFYTRSVEDMVRRHPEQWFWMHQRWKTRPHARRGKFRTLPSD